MKRIILKSILFLGAPLTLVSAVWLKFIKKKGTGRIGAQVFARLGIFPILDHYYQPLINPGKYLKKSLREDRNLPGIDFNVEGQLSLLARFHYNDELLGFPLEKTGEDVFYYDNGSYCSGDAEYLYNVIRFFKPKNIVEIGSGHSTLMARNAIARNKIENAEYACRHTCIEPFEMPWLEKVEVELIREMVERVDISYFQKLEKDDVLFIDSSHIIRPQGDVLFEYLEILPTLKSGVIVHVHDIFTPKDYLDEWIREEHLLWNEQYLLEAFLTFNSEFRIIGALNYLKHKHQKELADKCPIFANQSGREPGAFWMIKK